MTGETKPTRVEQMLSALDRVYSDGYGKWESTAQMHQAMAAVAVEVAQSAEFKNASEEN